MAYDFPASPTVGQAYQGWVYDGEKWVSIANAPNQSGVISIQVFTTSGTYTPSANMTTCVIECVGGGGAGGGTAGTANNYFTGAGGGSGGYSRTKATAAQIGTSQTVTVGARGNSGTTGANPGGAGTASSVGSLCLANGGGGGGGCGAAAGPSGGVGGSAGTGDFTSPGFAGNPGLWATVLTIQFPGGNGASSLFGGGANGGYVGNTASGPGFAAGGYGSGGSGGASNNTATTSVGGNGSAGIVIITEYGMIALSATSLLQGAVRFDLPQALSVAQQSQARSNIAVTKKNYIVNGGMMVSQENGSTAGTSTAYYPVDCFTSLFGHEGSCAAAQIAVATPGGSPNRIQIGVSTVDASVAAGNFFIIRQNLEGLRVVDLKLGTAAAKTITIQFGVFGPAGTYCVGLENSATNRAYAAEYTIAAGEANTDVVKSVTIPLDTSGTWLKDAGVGLYVFWTLMCGSTYQMAANTWVSTHAFATANQFNFMSVPSGVFNLFDVSLTEGTIAPPFQLPDYAEELRACRRYWQNNWIALEGTGNASMPVASIINYTPSMRATPTSVTAGTPQLITNMIAPVFTVVSNANAVACNSSTTATGRGYWYGPIYSNARV